MSTFDANQFKLFFMKYFLLLLVVLVSIAGCTVPNKQADANTALIDKYVQAVQNLDYLIMEDMLADNYMGYGPSYNDSISKEQAIANWKSNVENLYESITYTKSRNMAQVVPDGENAGEWVSNWAELTIVYKKDKRKVTLWTNTIYRIENNKIVKSYSFYNEADALEQLGYVFINPDDL
jgi:hypothetical protein